jgi:hypothetical protein
MENIIYNDSIIRSSNILTKSITKCTTTSTHTSCKKKNHVCKFHYSLLPMCEKKNSIKKNLKENDDISFSNILNFLNIHEITYILSLRIKLTKLHIFLKWTLKNIKANAFSIHIIHLWFANIDIQFILDPYVVATFCTSHMTKINKSITLELHFIIKNALHII